MENEPSQFVEFKSFRGTFATWDTLFEKASDFATQVGRDKLISISHSSDHSDGVVTVWFWSHSPKNPNVVSHK